MVEDPVTPRPERDPKDHRKVNRTSKIEWLPLRMLQVSPAAQRRYDPHRAAEMASNLDLDALGIITVSKRDGVYWTVDGQHRKGAVEIVFDADTKVCCEVFYDMTEAEEAELFLARDARVAVSAFDKYRIGLTAQRAIELEIDGIVRSRGLRVSKGGAWDSIGSVGGLRRVHRDHGPEILSRTLMVLSGAFEGDDQAFAADVLVGMGKVLARYDGSLDDEHTVGKLFKLKGGASVLQRKAEGLKRKLDRSKVDCMAGAIVDVLNEGEGPRARNRVEDWWK